MKKPLVILTGPTAVGKTELSIQLAKTINGAIVSADSMQVYRGMDIGSAKIRPEEMQGVDHYLIDVLDPEETFDVHTFQQMAKDAMEKIWANGQIPILTGGTGFYIQAVLYDIDFTEEKTDLSYRQELETRAKTEGSAALFEELKRVDPASAEMIHENNVKRVIRALEFYHETGEKISVHNEKERQKSSPYQFAYYVLTDDRAKLYQQIDSRVDQMMQQGLVSEVQQLKARGCRKDMVSMQGLGYKEILAFLDNECTLEEAVYIIKRDTRHFAKRQLTWFRREKEVTWIDKAAFSYDNNAILQFIKKDLHTKEIFL
ncbi:MAG: tRNA (adenosine(37)-N6)-dimethylallyltransferase MiaA [Lachnospiraceae bacterium]